MPLFLRVILFTILVPGSVTGWVPFFLLRLGGSYSTSGVAGTIGLVLLGIGIAIYCSTAFDFAARGRGTPGPWESPRKLVTKGLYRFSRNPMYVGIASILFGEAILVASPARVAYAIVVCFTFHLWTMAFEEPALRRIFGASYRQYCSKVGRWL